MLHDKNIALVAHDNKKGDLVEWAQYNRDLLAHHKVYATGATGEILERELGFKIMKFQSGPLGGDQQIGTKIVADEINFLIFFWDPLEPMPHDPDVKALLRMAVVWNIPIACNRASVDTRLRGLSHSENRQGRRSRLSGQDNWGQSRISRAMTGPTPPA